MIQYESQGSEPGEALRRSEAEDAAVHGGARAEKQRIRQEVRIISEQLTPEYRREASREITRQVLSLPFWKEAGTIMAYWSLPTEPDTQELMETALQEGKTLLLPHCVDARRMTALPVKDLDGVKPGKLGIPEPEDSESSTAVPEPDLILVPCMAAAPHGVRLGHGAGYYDRFLAEHPGKAVCLCFRALLRADLPAEETDIITDLVVSD